MSDTTEKRTRKPGGGRKPLPADQRTRSVTVWLTEPQVTHCQKHGDLSAYVRNLIDSTIVSPSKRVYAGKPRGGVRERAGRPPADISAITVRHRRCVKCGRFVSFSHDHRCEPDTE